MAFHMKFVKPLLLKSFFPQTCMHILSRINLTKLEGIKTWISLMFLNNQSCVCRNLEIYRSVVRGCWISNRWFLKLDSARSVPNPTSVFFRLFQIDGIPCICNKNCIANRSWMTCLPFVCAKKLSRNSSLKSTQKWHDYPVWNWLSKII